MPSTSQEEWRRTDIRGLRLDRFGIPKHEQSIHAHQSSSNGDGSYVTPTALLSVGVDLAGHASTLDSQPVAASLDPDLARKGVLFGSLDELVRDHGKLLESYLHTRAVDPYHDKFSALHAACWSGGMVLYVPKGVVLENPVHMFSVLAAGAESTTITH